MTATERELVTMWRGLPPADSERHDSSLSAAQSEQAGSVAVRVLIVEDEYFVAMDVETILSDAGCEVVGIATSADAAVAKARQSLPDLILMDIRLQGDRDGIDAATEITRDLKIPIVFVTANPDAVSGARAEHVRAIATVSKPFTREALLIALAAYRDLPQEPHC
jgi:two-component system, response regulator PdtaR